MNDDYEITGNLQTNNNLVITSNGNITNKTNLETGNETTISTTGNFQNDYITNPNDSLNIQSAAVYDISSNSGIEISAQNITNYGSIQTGGNLTLTATADFNNTSSLKSETENSTEVNRALLLSLKNTNIYAQNAINSGGEILSFESINFAKDSSQATSTSLQNLAIKLGANNTQNNYISAVIDANQDININTQTLVNQGYNYDLDKTQFFGYNVNYNVYKGGWGEGYYNLMNQDQAVSTLETMPSFITAGNDININNATVNNYSSGISAGNNIGLTNIQGTTTTNITPHMLLKSIQPMPHQLLQAETLSLMKFHH